MAEEVSRTLVLKEEFTHATTLQCPFCRITGAFDLKLEGVENQTRREGLQDAIKVSIQKRLRDNEEEFVSLMSHLCLFRSKTKHIIIHVHEIFVCLDHFI